MQNLVSTTAAPPRSRFRWSGRRVDAFDSNGSASFERAPRSSPSGAMEQHRLVGEELSRTKDRNPRERRHDKQILVWRDRTVGSSLKGRLKHLVADRVATPQLRSNDGYPLGNSLKLANVDRSDLPSDTRVKPGTVQTGSHLVERGVRTHDRAASERDHINSRTRRPSWL